MVTREFIREWTRRKPSAMAFGPRAEDARLGFMAIPVAPGQNVERSVVQLDQNGQRHERLDHQGGQELQESRRAASNWGPSRLPPATGLGGSQP